MTVLKEIIDIGEGYKVEFKEKVGKDLAEEIVAFANASGGRIYLGITDTGEIEGINISNNLRSRVQDIARNCDPSIEIGLEEHDNVLVVVVEEGEDKPYSCSKGFFLRQGPNSNKMFRDEILALATSDGRIRFDEQTNTRFSYFDDFDVEKFDYYLTIAGIEKTGNQRELLINLGLCDEEMRFNNAGVLMFAKEPSRFIRSSKVVCALFGHTRADILDRKELDMGVVKNIEEATNYVTRHIDVRFEIKELRRKEIPQYPIECYREAIVNAVLHRDYFETSGEVVVEVHKDSLRITNPGGLVKWLNPEDFGAFSRPRNPLLVDLLLRTVYVERLGTGISRMRVACQESGLPLPQFKFDEYNFAITVKSKKTDVGEADAIEGVEEISASTEEFGVKFGEEFGVKFGEEFGVTGERLARMSEILLEVYMGKSIDLSEIAERYGLSKRMIEKDMTFLRKNNIIVFKGSPKTGKYFLTKAGMELVEAVKG